MNEAWRQNPNGFWNNPLFDAERFWRILRAEIQIALGTRRAIKRV